MITFASLISGSSGNATLVSDGRTKLLVDCGMSGSCLKKILDSIDISAEDIDALLLTHEHSDHVKGAGVIARRYNIPVYATRATFDAMSVGVMPHIEAISPDSEFCIGSIGVHPFSIPHDAADPVGYNFFAENKKITVATDMGHMDNDLFSNLYGSNMILLESNHDIEMLRMGSYPFSLKQRILSDTGHLSNDMAAKTVCALIKSGTEHIMLGHLSKENNNPQVAYMTAENELNARGIILSRDATLTVAERSTVTFCGGLS